MGGALTIRPKALNWLPKEPVYDLSAARRGPLPGVPRFLKLQSSQSHRAKSHRAAGRKALSSAAIHG